MVHLGNEKEDILQGGQYFQEEDPVLQDQDILVLEDSTAYRHNARLKAVQEDL